jgi:glycosyltransferase involved in cell wall biosynthesis
MEWCATCTKVGAEYLKSITPEPQKVRLIYHGLSIDRVPEGALQRGQSDGTDAKSPVKLLSVGRAVEKKGFDVLLEALAKLPPDLNWRWIHVGDGAIMGDLKRQADELGLQNRIEWRGAQDQTAVFELLRRADLFVLPSREGSDGDKDGLPNVLMEAQSQELACLSTNFSEIPELIEDGRTGVLVPPGDGQALAVALERLIRSPDERQKLGRAGRERVTRCFDAAEGIGEIAELLRDTMQDHVRQSLQRELA